MTRKVLITLLAAFFAFCRISESNAGIVVPTPRSYSDTWDPVSRKSYNGENHAHLVCTPKEEYAPPTRYCKVYFLNATDSEAYRTCDVTLQVTNDAAYIPDDLTIYAFGRDKAIVLWKEFGLENFLHTSIVSPRDCRTIDTKIHFGVFLPDNGNNIGLALGNESFDVFDFASDTCDGKLCWMTVDEEGKITHGPIRYFPAKRDLKVPDDTKKEVDRIEENAPEKGHLFTVSSHAFGTYYFVGKPDGTIKLLAESWENGWWSGKSVANNLIGVCWKETSPAKCAQYDSDGKMKLEVSLDRTVDLPKNMYNLANGGFLVAATINDSRDTPVYLVSKIDANGQKLGSFTCSGDLSDQNLYQNEEGKYCLAVPCNRLPYDGSAVIQCFDDTVFSQ